MGHDMSTSDTPPPTSQPNPAPTGGEPPVPANGGPTGGEPTGRPGRYQRSVGGLVAALALTAVAIVVVMWVLGLFRNDLEIEVEEVDYLASVAAAQEAGLRPVYPESLPEGWIATGAEVPTTEGGGFEIRLLTDEERFVGIRQAMGESVTGLLTTYVDEEPAEGDPVEIDSIAPTWETWTDGGGDTAYVAELGGRDDEVVIVYGSAPAADLRDVVERLTTAPVE